MAAASYAAYAPRMGGARPRILLAEDHPQTAVRRSSQVAFGQCPNEVPERLIYSSSVAPEVAAGFGPRRETAPAGKT